MRDHTGVLNDTLACETAATGNGAGGALSATMQIRQENKGFPKSDPGSNVSLTTQNSTIAKINGGKGF